MSGLPSSIRGALVSVVAVTVSSLAALCYPLARVALEGLTPLTLASSRLLLASLVLALFASAAHRPWPGSGARRWLALCAGPLLASAYAAMFLGAPRIDPGLATILENTQPLIASACAWALLREPIERKAVAALVVGFTGVWLVIDEMSGPTGASIGIALVLLGAACVAGANVTQRHVAERVDPIAGAAIALGAAGGVLLVAALVVPSKAPPSPVSPRAVVALVVLALVGTAASQAGWLWVLRHMELARASVFGFMPALIGLGISWAFDGKPPGPRSFVGASMIGTAAVVASVPSRRTGTAIAPPSDTSQEAP